ncbi:DUF2087 domain-containing protein [Kitasatospora sp. NPDC088391]|uniref:DUF2087 domain-containing protein n=1 Tax=Kitasatospora sp. NPDC088391 TaxID=3364074 RepID=UPI0037FDE971
MSAHEPPATLAAFFTDGRLTSIPRKPARRTALLEHLAQSLFDPDRSYSEREVNEALLTVHPDTSMLRRYLVEALLLSRTRDGASYRRAAAAVGDGADAQPPAA